MKTRFLILALCIIALAALAACAYVQNAPATAKPTAMPTVTVPVVPTVTATVTATPTATPTLYPGAAIEGDPISQIDCLGYTFKLYYKARWGQDTFCHPTEGFIDFSVVELGVYEINGDGSINRGGLTCQSQGDTLVCAPGSEPFTAAGSSFTEANSLTTFRLVIEPSK
jgi:hypothetical protein